MPNYLTVTEAAEDTLRKILAQRTMATPSQVHVTTKGGSTASVHYDVKSRIVLLNLPSLPASAWLTRADADRITGYVVHEACHVLHTDWAAWRSAVAKGARIRTWTNALEDLRIEAAEIAAGQYGAMRDLLGRVSDRAFQRAVAGRIAAQQPAPGAHGVIDAPYVASVLGRLTTGYAIPSAAGLDKALCPETRALVRAALRRVWKCKDTRACLRLAIRLVELEATMNVPPQDDAQDDLTPQDDPPAPTPQPTDDDAQDAQDDSAQDAQDAQDDSAQDAQDDAQDAQDAQDDSAQDAQDDSAQDAQDDTQDDAQDDAPPAVTTETPAKANEPTELGDDDLADVTGSIANANGTKTPTERTTGLHGWKTTQLPAPDVPEDLLPERGARAALDGAFEGKAMLQQEIQRLLTADEQRWITHRETTGRLDRRALPRMRVGAADVFARKHDRPGESAAVCVLWDLSSSMDNYGRMEGARGLVWELYRAAQAAGTPFGCYGFELPHPSHATIARAYLRTIIAMGERPTRPAARVVATRCRGFTGLAPAIPAAAQVLLEGARDATRHVLLVLTDGECDFGADLVRDGCKLVTQWGVEVVGLGINAEDTIARSFPDKRSVNVANVAELGRRGLRLVNDLLDRAQS